MHVRLYLVQHAEAEWKEKDPDRPLTEKGRADIDLIARFAAGRGVTVSRILHSGKTRAAQTAEMLGRHLRPEGGIRQTDGLSPMDDPKIAAEKLPQSEDVALVGHLPHLSKLAGLLLCGNPDSSPVGFRNGGIVALERKDVSSWSIAWVITPEILSQG